jgi:hypothetical protein
MDLWNTETPIKDIPGLDIDIPDWINDDISPSDVAAIMQGGCASGAYMDAVTYHQALDTMSEHGDEVLQYIEDAIGELPSVTGQSWGQMACTYVSAAVELWASSIEPELESFEPEEADEPEQVAP